MTGLEVVVGLLIGWFARRAKHLGERIDEKADKALDATLDAGLRKVHDLITDKLRDEPAVKLLEGEVADTGEASTRTQARVRLALEEAVDTDNAFATQLQAAVDEVQAAQAAAGSPAAGPGGVAISGGVSAASGGVAIGGVTSSGSVSITREDPPQPARP